MILEINNWKYEIYVVEEDDDVLQMDDGYYHSGVTDMKEQRIYLQKGLNEQQMWYTVVHELTHAYLQAYGLLQVEYTDEVIADIMGIYGKNILKDAEKLAEYYWQKHGIVVTKNEDVTFTKEMIEDMKRLGCVDRLDIV